MTARLKPKDRKEQILEEATRQAAKHGYLNLERQKIADAIGVSAALVSARCGTMPDLKRDVLRRAIAACKSCTVVTANGNGLHIAVSLEALTVVAQAIVAKDRRVRALAPEIRVAAINSLHS